MSKSVLINGVTYSNCPSVEIPLSSGSGNAVFTDTDDATAAAGNILLAKTAYVAGSLITGSMANNGAVSGAITTKAGAYTVPAGYHNGSGSVAISSEEQAKIISGNIKSGVTLLGIAGDSNVVNTAISSNAAAAAQILSGYKAYVNGALLTGSATVPTVSQDSSTHVLTIA